MKKLQFLKCSQILINVDEFKCEKNKQIIKRINKHEPSTNDTHRYGWGHLSHSHGPDAWGDSKSRELITLI